MGGAGSDRHSAPILAPDPSVGRPATTDRSALVNGADLLPKSHPSAPAPPAEARDATGSARSIGGTAPPRSDAGAFADFYARHYGDLVRLAVLVGGPIDAAPDLVQDCFLRLHARWTSVREPLPYMRRCVVHACASHHRRLARAGRLPSVKVEPTPLGADEMDDALAALSARQRAAVVLRYYADLPDADIARVLRCRPATVRSLIHRALRDLRKVIEP